MKEQTSSTASRLMRLRSSRAIGAADGADIFLLALLYDFWTIALLICMLFAALECCAIRRCLSERAFISATFSGVKFSLCCEAHFCIHFDLFSLVAAGTSIKKLQ